MAFRVALTVLGLIVLAASTASAQFSTADLAGTWIVHGSRVGLMPGADTGWLQGVVTFDAGGAVVDAVVFDQGENFADLTPGALTVGAGGDVAGRLGSASIRGRIVAGKMQIVGVATADEGDADETSAVFILVKRSTGGFGQADATGTWRVNTLLVPERSAEAEYVFGQIVVDGEGAITGGALTSSDGSSTTVLEGSLFVSPDGTFGGQLDIGPLGDDHSFFSGTFTPDKGLMVGATSRSRPNDSGHGMFVLQREPDAVYDPADTTGTWDLFSVQARNDDGSVGAWLSGTLTVVGQGLITGGTLVDGLGGSFPIRSGLLSVSAEGFVVGGLVTEQGVIVVQGSMLPDKAQIVGVDDLAANLLNNGRFDTPDIAGCFTNFTSAPAGFGWVIDGSLGIDVVNGRADGCWDGIGGTRNPDGIDQSIDIDGDSSISQRVSTVPGQSYELTLFYSRNPRLTSAPRRGVVTVEGNSTLVSETLVHDVPNSTSDMNWLPFSTVFVADSTVTTLSIGGDASNGTEGFVVDNVTLAGQVQSRGLFSLVRAGESAPPATTVQFAQSVFVANEHAAGAVITVERSGAPAALTEPFTVTGLTAVPDQDFREVSGVLTFTPDTSSRTFTVPLVDDRLVDGDRSVRLSLGPPTGAGTGAMLAAQAALGSPATATLLIRDDDQPGIIKLSKASHPDGRSHRGRHRAVRHERRDGGRRRRLRRHRRHADLRRRPEPRHVPRLDRVRPAGRGQRVLHGGAEQSLARRRPRRAGVGGGHDHGSGRRLRVQPRRRQHRRFDRVPGHPRHQRRGRRRLPGPPGRREPVDLQTGDLLFGATVDAVLLGGMNNAGQIVFTAFLDDEREVIAVATPDP
ncbi:MAG TPA: Calx-beta domain-containing protein [Methylomirabilota bacterium]